MSPRIIPADAGSTISVFYSDETRKDHPRGCGEHAYPCHPGICLKGSSPRMRGALRPSMKMNCWGGIIPADAGSTSLWRGTGPAIEGSSPRMRGAQAEGVKEHPNKRIIPADAGSTYF